LRLTAEDEEISTAQRTATTGVTSSNSQGSGGTSTAVTESTPESNTPVTESTPTASQGFEDGRDIWVQDTNNGATEIINQDYTNIVRSGSKSCLIRTDDTLGMIYSSKLNSQKYTVEYYFYIDVDKNDGRVYVNRLMSKGNFNPSDRLELNFKNGSSQSAGDGTNNYTILIKNTTGNNTTYGTITLPQQEFIRIKYTVDKNAKTVDFQVESSLGLYTDTINIPILQNAPYIAIGQFNSVFRSKSGDMIIDDITITEL
jgi:hypothetical protein